MLEWFPIQEQDETFASCCSGLAVAGAQQNGWPLGGSYGGEEGDWPPS